MACGHFEKKSSFVTSTKWLAAILKKKSLGDYRVINTSSATNQRREFSIITYVIILICIMPGTVHCFLGYPNVIFSAFRRYLCQIMLFVDLMHTNKERSSAAEKFRR